MQTTISPGQSIRQRYVAQKLNLLLDVMQESKRGYERIATQSTDKNFQRALSGLAIECGQYINELTNQICSLGAKPSFEKNKDQYIWNQISTNIKKQDDILNACYGSERIILTAYREVLNDPSVLHPLRQMITYQLNGMKYAFVKVKLLNTAISA
ncbi:MAG: hypothetical protein K0Q66_1517 [Chitinophagaceae bacterium]|nr:hypothetical protein [Chitinophagaceae bacterium]